MSRSTIGLIWCLIIFFALTVYDLLDNKASNSQKHEALSIAKKAARTNSATVQLLGQHHDLVIIENPFMLTVEPGPTQVTTQIALKLTEGGSLISGIWKGERLAPEKTGACSYSFQKPEEKMTVVFDDVYKPTCALIGAVQPKKI